MAEIQPRKIRTSDEDVNHRSIHSMKDILQHQIFVAVEDAMEGGADEEQKN